MATTNRDLRNRAFGQEWSPTPIDNFGIWLSARQIRRRVGSFRGLDVVDVGCGYHASFARTILDEARSVTLVDVDLAPELEEHPSASLLVGHLPGVLTEIADESVDIIVCNSVLEHLWDPISTLEHFHRALRPGGTAMLNVPSWRGKTFLELSAFRLRLSPPDEMDDHKTYYDPRDLWPLLVRAGFRPHDIKCFLHKMGLNTFATCRRSVPENGAR